MFEKISFMFFNTHNKLIIKKLKTHKKNQDQTLFLT